MKTNESPANEQAATSSNNTDGSPSKRGLIVKLLSICLLFTVIGVALYIYESNNEDRKAQKVVYLKNNNDVVCARVTPETLQCENIRTGDLKRFILPEVYRDALIIKPSPDGSRLLIETRGNGIVVTDSSFNEIKKIFTPAEIKNRYPTFNWADGSKQLLIREVKREVNDADFLPEPIVVSLLDLESGENRRVYKTGEINNVESIEVIGGNDQYVYVALAAQKNWVAQDVDPPPKIINAIRLTNGFVRQVDSHQIDLTNDYLKLTRFQNYNYDSSSGLFYISGQRANNEQIPYFVVAQLEENEFGLVLRKVYESNLKITESTTVLLTSRGVYVSGTDSKQTFPYTLVDENGNKTELKLVVGESNETVADSVILSFSSMPNLPEAQTVQPKIEEYVKVPTDTPQSIRNFIESLATCGTNVYTMVELSKRVGEEQLEVLGGCENGTSYYILKGGKYDHVLSAPEGLSCEERDKAGLSPQLTSCYLPGEFNL